LRYSRTIKAWLLLIRGPLLNRYLTINTKLPKLARQILGYLREHPEAQDTLEGIMVWWVSERAIKKWLPETRRALAALVAQEYVAKHLGAGGGTFYHLNRSIKKQQGRVLQKRARNHDNESL
jgi:hypothetical protein